MTIESDLKTGYERILDPAYIIWVLYRRKFTIAAVCLLVGAGALLYGLTMPKTYRAETGIIIQSPSQSAELGVSQAVIRVETIQALADSRTVLRLLYDYLQKDDKTKGVSLSELGKCLQTRTIRENFDPRGNLVPAIVFTAELGDPELAAAVANAWAEVVVERTRGIYRARSDALRDFFGNAVGDYDTRLQKMEMEFVEKKIAADVEFRKPLLAALETNGQKVMKEIDDLRLQERMGDLEIGYLRSFLAGLEMRETWVGDLAYAYLSIHPEAAASGDLALWDRIAESGGADTRISTASLSVMACARRLVAAQRDLESLRSRESLEVRLVELAGLREQLPGVGHELSKARVEYAASQKESASLQASLAGLPEKVLLHKAITDDALWDAHLSGRDSKDVQTPLLTEEKSVVYEKARETVFQSQARMESLRERVDALTLAEAGIRQQIATLSAETRGAEYRVAEAEKAAAREEKHWEGLAERYRALRDRLSLLESDQAMVRARIDQKREVAGRLLPEMRSLAEEMAMAEQAVSAQERNLTVFRKVWEQVNSERIAYLQTEATEALQQGVSVLFSADPPTERLPLGRVRMIAIAVMGAFVCAVVFLLLQEMLAMGTSRFTGKTDG